VPTAPTPTPHADDTDDDLSHLDEELFGPRDTDALPTTAPNTRRPEVDETAASIFAADDADDEGDDEEVAPRRSRGAPVPGPPSTIPILRPGD
jgi:hypothetical protein